MKKTMEFLCLKTGKSFTAIRTAAVFQHAALRIGKGEYAFSLLSLEQIRRVKGYFQNRDALLTDFPDYFSKEDIGRMADARLRPYLFHTKWFPFAEYCDSCYLMLDFAPGKAGKEGQILCYVHDPDSVTYAAENITDVVGSIIKDNHIVKRNRQ